jgi:hypothetical protein
VTSVCGRCGCAVEVLPTAVLVAGRVVAEVRLCPRCRFDVIDPIRSKVKT